MYDDNFLTDAQDNTAALALIQGLKVETFVEKNQVGWLILYRVASRLKARALELSDAMLSE